MGVTQTGLLERLQACSEVVTLPEQLGPCYLVAWIKQAGEVVEQFQAIAVVEQDQVATTITATHSGRLRGVVVQKGMLVQPNQVLCSIETPYSRSFSSPVRQPLPRAKLPEQLNSPDVLHATPGQGDVEVERRSAIIPIVEQAVRERAERRAATATSAPTTRKKTPRTKAKVYRVTPDQVQRVKALVQQVRTHENAPVGPPISESELVRAGLELLDSLSLEAVLAIVDENREREQAGKYGAGWPRPGHQRKRKKGS